MRFDRKDDSDRSVCSRLIALQPTTLCQKRHQQHFNSGRNNSGYTAIFQFQNAYTSD